MPDDTPLITAYLTDRHVPCPGCGYDLHGAKEAVCPECGDSLEVGMSSSRRPPASRAEWGAAGVFLAFSGTLTGYLLLRQFWNGPAFDRPSFWLVLCFLAIEAFVGVCMLRRWFRLPRNRRTLTGPGELARSRLRGAACLCGWAAIFHGAIGLFAVGVQWAAFRSGMTAAQIAAGIPWYIWTEHVATLLEIPLGAFILLAARHRITEAQRSAGLAKVAGMLFLVLIVRIIAATGIVLSYALWL